MLTRTTTQLLESLRDHSNTDLWREFDQRYRPVLVGFARSQGLAEEEAAEVAQATLAQFTADYHAGRYDRSRGRLSTWIIGIARTRIANAGRARQRRQAQRGESALVVVADEAEADAAWGAARRHVVLHRALERLRTRTKMDERTIRAFELCALRNVPPEQAAPECGMTVAEVYVAKNRAIAKLREIVATLDAEYDEL